VKEIEKLVGSWCLLLAVNLYMTFVLQTMWNWFATPALHVESISYWNMYGLVLIVLMFSARNKDSADADHWHRTLTLLEACIPDDKRAQTIRQLEEGTVSKLLLSGVITEGSKALGATVSLVVGFGIHTLLM
jgi:hypothetical protein